jgi:radical SAM superfamily enzyme YgiQ (UPF0313 family)
MRLALVFNPFSYKTHEENLRVVQRYFGLFPPLSMSWVASIARAAGHEVMIIDARTLRLTMPEVAAALKQFRPDVIGAMMTTYMFPETLAWLKYLRGELHTAGIKCKVLVGGYNLRVYPNESVSHPEIDFGCVEHAYYTIPALFAALENGETDLSAVPGLAWKRGGEIVVNPHPQKINFDLFPNPARDLLPNELYAEFPTRRKNFTAMVTSLGCPFKCSFCEAGGCEYNPRSPATVVAEMKECAQRDGVREIDIFDYEFTGARQRVLDICDGIKKERLDINWACRSRVDTADPELMKAMYSAGCRRIYWGIESGSQATLDSLQKGIKLEQIVETMRASRRAGLENLGFFLVGVPGETKETVRQTVAFAKKLDLDYVQFSKLLAKPRTPLWKDMVAATGKDYWKDWVLGKETDRELPRPWLKDLTNAQVDELARWAYVSYHSRPLFLLRHALKCRSFSEFFRKTSAFLAMLFSKGGGRFLAYPENIFKVMAGRLKWKAGR